MTRRLPSDQELWGAIQQDNSKAFDLLFERYWEKIYSTCYGYLKNEEACKEIVHNIFLDIWQKRETLEVISFKHYLTSAARYQVYKVIRKEKLNPIQLIEDYSLVPHLDWVRNQGEEKMRDEEIGRNLEEVLNTLPKRCKEVFVLSRMKNFTNDEIACKLGISKRSVENQLTQALKVLRLALKGALYAFIFIHFQQATVHSGTRQSSQIHHPASIGSIYLHSNI
ncbi:RNA polymerase sigma factor [Pedobacter gandavensis]|uniref:RNA polymerase sigma-70 factor n=1 Tax=Pedobacter gandavensis TaxID=2679963 RepID=A0ABR6ERM3_9SPHI|nr:RNA polymerase sigma-70 factor [Pedobacter gandavensis]MBB2147909.1 RNA polymerase sigma-70 factor [Pedobacter gandavensis]